MPISFLSSGILRDPYFVVGPPATLIAESKTTSAKARARSRIWPVAESLLLLIDMGV